MNTHTRYNVTHINSVKEIAMKIKDIAIQIKETATDVKEVVMTNNTITIR